jgi:putative Holliday junction resolvase
VVGLPCREDGGEHPVGRLARRFAQRLQGRFGLAVALVDERLTSNDAERSLRETGVRGARLKSALDPVAAQRILESYFAEAK